MTLVALEMHLADAMAERLAALTADGGDPVFAAVLSALDTAALTAWPKTPAALVLPISDEAEESTTRRVENAPVQHVVRVGVSVMVSAPNDRGGARGRERLSALLARARQALAGWTPPGQREGCCPSAAGGSSRWRTGGCNGSTSTKSAASPAPASWKRNRETLR